MTLRHLVLPLAMLCGVLTVSAQEEDKNMFNHLSVGVTAGTPGIGFDVAAPIGNYVQVRAGVAFMPSIKFGTDLDVVEIPSDFTGKYPETVEVEAKVGFTNGKLLFDVFPFKSSSFHITAGAYFGSSAIIKAYNKEDGLLQDIADYNATHPGQEIGYELGDYLLTPDDKGNISAEIKTASFKPYVGLGFGRAVPKKRIGFMFEAGVQFWGSPKLYCNGDRLTEEDFNGEDGGLMKTLSKITVYPVINFRICGRIL